MADVSNKDKWILQLQTELQRLKESEIECAKTATQYSELESIICKQLKSQFIELTDCPSNTETNSSCKSEDTLKKTGSKHSYKTEDKTVKKVGSDKMLKKVGENPVLLPSKKSSGDVSKISSSEQFRNSHLQKRIRQYHENIDSITALSEKSIAEKKKFLIHIEKLNSKTWKNPKMRSLTEKLEAHMNSS